MIHTWFLNFVAQIPSPIYTVILLVNEMGRTKSPEEHTLFIIQSLLLWMARGEPYSSSW